MKTPETMKLRENLVDTTKEDKHRLDIRNQEKKTENG